MDLWKRPCGYLCADKRLAGDDQRMDAAVREEFMALNSVDEWNDFWFRHRDFFREPMDEEMRARYQEIIKAESHKGEDPMCHREIGLRESLIRSRGRGV